MLPRSPPPVAIYKHDLDRCLDHGIWFDPAELQTVLQDAPHFHVDEGSAPSILNAKPVRHFLSALIDIVFKVV